MTDRDHRTRERAYHLWEQAGRPLHRDHEFWVRAQAEIDKEGSTASKAAAGGGGKPKGAKTKTAAKAKTEIDTEAGSKSGKSGGKTGLPESSSENPHPSATKKSAAKKPKK